MESHAKLLDHLARVVQTMRDYQRQRTPGCPLAIRRECEKWEAEVDALVGMHLLPELPELAPPEVIQ